MMISEVPDGQAGLYSGVKREAVRLASALGRAGPAACQAPGSIDTACPRTAPALGHFGRCVISLLFGRFDLEFLRIPLAAHDTSSML